MPAVAAGAVSEGAAFYWHLGDFRALYDFDEDILASARSPERESSRSPSTGNSPADDFLQNQIVPFGAMPVYLAIGNHELVAPKSRGEFLAQFADWFNAPPIQSQRLKDNPKDHRLKTYYHWVQKRVDFVALDNASNDQFDSEQIGWLEKLTARDATDPAVTTIVAGMHAALPDSLAADHSMSDWAQREQSGRRVYAALLKARALARKFTSFPATHTSHERDLRFACSAIPLAASYRAWISSTTGAVRYALPPRRRPGERSEREVAPGTCWRR